LKQQFINYLQQGAKPRDEWRVGVEIELFGFERKSKQRLDNEQVQAVLRELAKSDADLIFEESLVVGAATEGGRWTVEPGGQIEYSGAAHRSLAAVEQELQQNLADLKQVSENLGLVFLAVGFDPLRTIDEQNWFMKPRYKLMKPYLQTRGRKAWDMMTRTCSVQVNVDYADERDLIKKFIVGNRLAPTVAAIFANSPFADGKVSGYKSTRLDAWNETDSSRCNVSPLASKDEFTLDDFVEYALDVPMLFVRKGGKYLENFTGKPFREFLVNKELAPTLQDFQDHLTTIFTEARLKSYIELRAADCGDLQHTMAVAALWKGLLYEETALREAFRIAPKLTAAQYCELQKSVAKNGLQAVYERVNIIDLAKEIVLLARRGLERVAPDEVEYLEVLRQKILLEERSSADVLLAQSNGSIDKVFELTAI
jgi:glutamate--cysteine ligase